MTGTYVGTYAVSILTPLTFRYTSPVCFFVSSQTLASVWRYALSVVAILTKRLACCAINTSIAFKTRADIRSSTFPVNTILLTYRSAGQIRVDEVVIRTESTMRFVVDSGSCITFAGVVFDALGVKAGPIAVWGDTVVQHLVEVEGRIAGADVRAGAAPVKAPNADGRAGIRVGAVLPTLTAYCAVVPYCLCLEK